MFTTKQSNEPFKEAGEVLSRHLKLESNTPVLLLSSGGSALSILEFVDEAVLGEHITFSVLDERYTEVRAERNFEQLKASSFWNKAVTAGASFIDVAIQDGERAPTLAARFEENLRQWREKCPEGKVVITQGIGEDGHTAGIFPCGEKQGFDQLFNARREVVGYTLEKGTHRYTERVTVSMTFLREEVDVAVVVAVGGNKKNVLQELFEQEGNQHTLPALIVYDICEVYLISDLSQEKASWYDESMNASPLHVLKTFDSTSLPDLDVAVLGALELFETEELPVVDVSMYTRPLVVGSGNAEAAGRIIFNSRDAIFASESTFEEKLRCIESIDGVVLVSASGGKHAPLIARRAHELGKPISLITNNKTSEAASFILAHKGNNVFVFPKNREPYTYNTSTYLGMILGGTRENPAPVRSFIEKSVAQIDFSHLGEYKAFYLIIPDQFSELRRMFQIKFIELFGRKIARDIETGEYVKHATTVVPSDELFISFGERNDTWGKSENRLHIPLPHDVGYAAMMAIGYYVIGQIQKAHPPYFKENIQMYVEQASKAFGHTIDIIVE